MTQENGNRGLCTQERSTGTGPAIWLAGDPADLEKWLPMGAAGIVTNTVVLNQMVQKYGQIVGRRAAPT